MDIIQSEDALYAERITEGCMVTVCGFLCAFCFQSENLLAFKLQISISVVILIQ